jgi:hypothetical protein
MQREAMMGRFPLCPQLCPLLLCEVHLRFGNAVPHEWENYIDLLPKCKIRSLEE